MRYETVDAHQLPNVVMNLGTFLTFKKKHVVNKFTITQMLHVWNIYLRVHLGHIYGINVGKYSSPMGHLEHRNPKPLGGSSPVELVIPYDVKRPQSCGNHPIWLHLESPQIHHQNHQIKDAILPKFTGFFCSFFNALRFQSSQAKQGLLYYIPLNITKFKKKQGTIILHLFAFLKKTSEILHHKYSSLTPFATFEKKNGARIPAWRHLVLWPPYIGS